VINDVFMPNIVHAGINQRPNFMINFISSEYPAEQIRNYSELPSLTPEFEISYSSSHVPEDFTINLFSSLIPLPLPELPSYLSISPTDTDLIINDYTSGSLGVSGRNKVPPDLSILPHSSLVKGAKHD